MHYFLNWKSKVGKNWSSNLKVIIKDLTLPVSLTYLHTIRAKKGLSFPALSKEREKAPISWKAVNISLPHWLCLCNVSIHELIMVDREMGRDD